MNSSAIAAFVARLIIDALTAWIITAGTALLAFMVHNGAVVLPSRASVLVAIIGGAVQAAMRIQGRIAHDVPFLPPPAA